MDATVVSARALIQDNGRMSTLHPDRELMELIDRVAAQDDSALKALYERTSSKLFGLALRIVRQRDAAEDVLQDAFVAIWRGAGSYRASLSPPMAWMGLIVRSRALDALRKRTTDRSDVTDELDDLLSDTLEGDGANPMDVTEASEQAFALHQCLAKLDGKQRETPPTEKLLDGEQEAKIIAMRMGPPPQGHADWTLRLLSRKIVELEIVESISHETVRRTLKKTA